MASLIPFTSSHHPPCPTWLTGCFSRTLCLSVIYDSGFQHYTPSLTNWNPDSSRYIPICEPLSVYLQCNWWAILGRGNYIPCVLDISIPCWPLFLSHPVCKTPGWGHRGHHMNIRSSNPREAHPLLLTMTLWWCWGLPLTMVSICLCGMRDSDQVCQGLSSFRLLLLLGYTMLLCKLVVASLHKPSPPAL